MASLNSPGYSWMPLSAGAGAERRSIDILKHSPAPRSSANRTRSVSMSVDYSTNGSHQSLYGQNDMDHTFTSLQAGDLSSGHGHSSSQLPHSLDRSDPLDVGDHGSFDVFGSSSNHSLASQRYRTNGSSSSSLGPSYPLGVDTMYPPPPFSNDLPPFHSSSHSYDLIGSLPSSYSSGKPSPLTPNDVSGLPHHSSFPFNGQSKDFSSSYHDSILDRRMPGVNGSFPSDFNDDFGPMGVNSGLGLNGFHPPSALHQFQDRLGRVQHESRFPGSTATHSFRPENGLPPSTTYHIDENMARLRLHGGGDLQTFIRPYLDQYIRTPNRLAFGERTVIVMSSKVAQKSYGTEKRFLCPPPTAIMIGNSWWSDVLRRGEEAKLSRTQEGSIEWTSATGKAFDVSDPPTGTTYIGRCVGKQLFISDVDEKKKKVEALVKIMAPSSDDEPERVIGTFPSRPIKVISKPSKKRQSAKNLEHRLDEVPCVSGSGSSFKGSDNAPLLGLDQRSRSQTPSFIARTASWDPFIMYIVDVNKPTGGIDTPPPPPPQPEYPSPPPNAIPFTNKGLRSPSTTTRLWSAMLDLRCGQPGAIIRKVDHATTVVGGGRRRAPRALLTILASGEVCGDPVSQLHKIAFEVYDPNKAAPEPGTPVLAVRFCRAWARRAVMESSMTGTAEAESPLMTPASPTVSTPTSSNGSADYFGGGSASSVPTSPDPSEFPSNDGGKVKKGKRGSSSGGGLSKPASHKGRRRPTSAGVARTATRLPSSGALWQVDIGETSVWTIVGTDQVRYNFYVPPVLFDNQNAPQTGSFPIPSKPVTPFPGVVKYLPPDRASEAPKSNCPASRAVLAKPNPHASKMLTVYGENFSKADPVTVFFGSDPSPYVEVRCTEVVGCLPPETNNMKRRPIILVRHDGVVFPSNTMYP
ncbi:hypothetical protein BC629DRAFT_1442421 [Irpex lacteus]|nr:hypothetical protein BC629DRAFT_1442421 [Irpex lacteus]